MRLEEVKVPEELLRYVREKGITELYPPQEQAIRAGLLEGKSLVVSSPTACYDAQTEVLTKDGWKLFKETSSDETALSMNPLTFEMEYVRAVGKVEQEYVGRMVSVEGKEVDFRVTENHNMFVASMNGARKTPDGARSVRTPASYSLKPAIGITDRWRFKSGGIWAGKRESQFLIPPLRTGKGGHHAGSTLPGIKVKAEDWLNFLGWYMAEGNTERRGDSYEVTLCQAKHPALAREAMERLGVGAVHRTGSKDHLHFGINNPQLGSYLLRFGVAQEKYVPEYVKDLPPDQIEVFLHSFRLGGGNRGRDGASPVFGTASKRLADDIQELLLKSGTSSLVRTRGFARSRGVPDGHGIASKHPLYQVVGRRCSEHDIDTRKPSKPVIERTTGETVYCLTLPKYHLLYVRRNGKAFWCGNSGKTLLALMAAYLKGKQGRKVVYLAPLRALASEKYAEFSELSRFGLRTTISTGDYDSSGESLGRSDIIVLTNERFDSVMRHRVSWINSVGLFIADEVHLAGNDNRGPTLEMILTKVLHLGLDAQLLALSATISNAKAIGEWLHATPVEMDWRPVPLREGVYDYGRVVFSDGEERPIPRSTYGAPIDVAMDTVKEGGQSLVFASTRRRAVSLATRAAELTQRRLGPDEKKAVSEASRRILGSGEETSLSRLLAEVVSKGAAFHHAGLEGEHRRIVEEYYRARAIKFLAATPTLCLPSGEEIFGNPGPVAIEALAPGDRVLTHGTKFEKVVSPTSRPYEGQLLKITPWFQLPMRMTPEHKVLIANRTRRSKHTSKANYHWWTYAEPRWIEAKYLKVGDLVVFPRIKAEERMKKLELPEIGLLRNQFGTVGRHWTRLKVRSLLLSPRTLEALGIYAAEGYSGKQGQVHFGVDTRENRLTSDILEWLKGLGLKPKTRDNNRHRRVISACSKQLASFLTEAFGTRASNKRIPHWVILLPNEKLAHFVRGMWRGDGDVAKTGAKVGRYSSTSRTMAKQLFASLVKMGFMPGIKKDVRTGKIAGTKTRITHRHDLYVVSVSGRQFDRFGVEVLKIRTRKAVGNREFNRGFIDSKYYYMPLRKIETEEYSGMVHNLEVEGHSSYVGSFVVHNSAGVNLPARRVVIADMTRYDAEQGGNAEISVLEYRQMAGRAGRPQYDDHGETVMVPPPSQPAADLLEHYTKEPPEPIRSRLADEAAMRSHTLATVATGRGLSKGDLDSLFAKTLLATQVRPDELHRMTEKALGYLLSERLLESHGGLFYATDFGLRVSVLYIDPATAVMFREGVRRAEPGKDYTAGLLHLVASTPDFEPKFPLRTKDYEEAMAFLEEHSQEMLQRHTTREFADYDRALQDMRSVMALHGWIDEWREEQLLSRLGVEPGDMHRAVDNAEWLLHSLGELCKLFKMPDVVRQADILRRRVASGVSAELVELTALSGVGRVRARALYSAGFKTLEDIKEAPAERLAAVEKVGTSVARKIKEQVARY
ncbi:MAG: DEAD/DEAH box helicase [Nitrososphaerota archaeon]|nr:DEAD/DEAH box helicase [Nitrososphaerota archaeon]